MALFAISDLHLPAREKPMDVFGAHWENHFERIREDWLRRVGEEDVVLLPGDLTWAMRLEDAMEDIARVGELPGRKIILRGNHDYWWSAIGRVRRALPEGMYALQNDAMELDGVLYAGSRGWTLPPYAQDADDQRIYARERLRLEMSLKHARSLSPDAPLAVMTHYPPLTEAARAFPTFWRPTARAPASTAICTARPSPGPFAAKETALPTIRPPATASASSSCASPWMKNEPKTRRRPALAFFLGQIPVNLTFPSYNNTKSFNAGGVALVRNQRATYVQPENGSHQPR